MNTELITKLLNNYVFVDLHPVEFLGDNFANLIAIFEKPNAFLDFLNNFSVALPKILSIFGS